MIVTIIGSMNKKDEMIKIKEYFERFGHKVNSPSDLSLRKQPLLVIQSTWINKIREADLVVVIPKDVSFESDGGSRAAMTFGELTSYEMAIAHDMNKRIVISNFIL